MSDAQERARKKPRLTQTALIINMTGLAALHVHLMRISHAQNAYDVLGLDAHAAYLPDTVKCHSKQLMHVLDAEDLLDLEVAVDVVECGLASCVQTAALRVLWATDILTQKAGQYVLWVMLSLLDSDSD
jgi:hypothetical protein